MPKQYTKELKKQIALSWQNGAILSAICEKHPIAQSTLYRWLKEYGSYVNGHTAVEYKKLHCQHDRLNHILQIIRLLE